MKRDLLLRLLIAAGFLFAFFWAVSHGRTVEAILIGVLAIFYVVILGVWIFIWRRHVAQASSIQSQP